MSSDAMDIDLRLFKKSLCKIPRLPTENKTESSPISVKRQVVNKRRSSAIYKYSIVNND